LSHQEHVNAEKLGFPVKGGAP